MEYPYFWGYADERGRGQGQGTNLNLPLAKGADAKIYIEAVDTFIETVRSFAPDYLIVAAGFDTHQADPIGGFALQTQDYQSVGARLASLDLPTLICQEGGYNTGVLGACVDRFLSGFGE